MAGPLVQDNLEVGQGCQRDRRKGSESDEGLPPLVVDNEPVGGIEKCRYLRVNGPAGEQQALERGRVIVEPAICVDDLETRRVAQVVYDGRCYAIYVPLDRADVQIYAVPSFGREMQNARRGAVCIFRFLCR